MAIEMNALENMDIDAILDVNVEDIPVAEGWKLPPQGVYRLQLLEPEIVGEDAKALVIKASILEAVELEAADAVAPESGTETNFRYNLPKGLQYFTKDFAGMLANFQGKKLAEALQQFGGIEVLAELKHRGYTKNDGSKGTSLNVSNVTPV